MIILIIFYIIGYIIAYSTLFAFFQREYYEYAKENYYKDMGESFILAIISWIVVIVEIIDKDNMLKHGIKFY